MITHNFILGKKHPSIFLCVFLEILCGLFYGFMNDFQSFWNNFHSKMIEISSIVTMLS